MLYSALANNDDNSSAEAINENSAPICIWRYTERSILSELLYSRQKNRDGWVYTCMRLYSISILDSVITYFGHVMLQALT